MSLSEESMKEFKELWKERFRAEISDERLRFKRRKF